MIRNRCAKAALFKRALSGVMLSLFSCGSFAVDDGSQLNNAFRVNYAGYMPQAAKTGLYIKSNQGVIRWSLAGTGCSGTEDTYVSNDKSSGDSFYIIDFSACTTEANAVRLVVGSDQSAAFDISNNPYGNLKYEFFDYFKDHEASATFQNARNNWASGLNLSFSYVKDAGDNGAYPTNTAEASWALINMLETYPDVNSYYSSHFSGAKTVYAQLRVLTEQFNFTMSNPRRLAIPKFHTNVNDTWASCSPHTGGTCIAEPETKATFATVRSLAAMARLHSVYANASDASNAYNLAKTGLNSARTEAFTCNQANKFGGEGGMYPDNDPASLWRDPKSDRDNCVSHKNNTQDDEYAALVELYIAAERLGNTADAANFKAQVTSHARFNEVSSYWWGAVAMEGSLSLLSNESRHSINLTTLKANLLLKANEIIDQQEKGYPGVTWNPNSTQWNNGDKDNVDNNVRWGSHRNALNDARIMMAASEVQKSKGQRADAARFARGAVKVLDHMFGINAVNLAMFTSNGYPFIENSVSRTHDGANSGDSWPGKLVLGPNNWTNANDGAMPAFGSKPGLKMFSLSGTPGWASREVSIDANASLVPVSYFATEVAPAIMLLDPIGGTAPTNPPAAPTSFSAVASKSSAIALSWMDNSGANADAETGFKIYMNTVNSKPASPVYTTAADANTWIAAGLTPQTTYYFWIEAFNGLGTSAATSAATSTLEAPAIVNLISNGDFSSGTSGWNCSLPQGSATCSVVAGAYFVNISNGGNQSWHVQPMQESIALVQGKTYTFAFDARATANRKSEIKVERSVSPWEDFSGIGTGQSLSTTMQRFKYTFTMNTSLNNARITMNLGNSNAGVYVDNLVLVEGDRDPCGAQAGCFPTTSSAPSSASSLPKSSASSSSVSSLSSVASSIPVLSSSAVNSSTAPLPSFDIQAESFTQMNGVQTENTQDSGGGLNVGWTDAGDWMTYSAVNLPCSGGYTVEYRVASGANGGTIKLEKAGGSPLFGSINFTGTGGWQTWKTVSHDVVLPAGSMSFGIAVTQGGWNLNWFRLTPKCAVTSSTGSISSASSSKSSVLSSISPSSVASSKLPSSTASSKASSLIASSRFSASSMSSDRNRYDAPRAVTAPVIDGVADAVWNQASWAPIDVFWLGSQNPNAQDFTGRYKAMWDAGNLYLLFDITDETLLDATVNPLERYWDDDCVEIFIDENKSGGNHNGNTNAWAYHISISGDVVDSTTGPAKLLNNHVTMRRVSNGTKHMWEMSMRVYGENYNDNASNTPVALFAGKLMGFSAAYNDNDASSQRESMMGSVDTQGHKDNLGYQDASVFGAMRLIDNSQGSSKASSSSAPTSPTTVVLQAEDYVRATDLTPGNTGGVYRQGDVDIEVTTDVGGGHNVGWTEASESLDFDTNLAEGYQYDIFARVASKTGGSFRLWAGSNQPLQTAVPNTGDWQTWQTIKVGSVFVFAGGVTNGVHIEIDGGGFNLNWIQISPNCASDPSCIDNDKDGVSDELDQCPNTSLGAQVNENGCVPGVSITAKAAAQAMGKGFNLGQMFESTQHAPTFANAKAKIDAYYDKGFRNVRIPITWTGDVQGNKLVNSANIGDVNLNHPRLAVIKQVVDYALTKPGMYVVINAHHEDSIKDGNQWAVLERLWQDIAGIFATRDYRLMYEFLNEPHHGANNDPLDPGNLRNMVGKAYAKVRAIDLPRIVIIGGNQWFAADEMAKTWPHLNDVGGGKDKFIMAEYHHYNPWTFNGDNQGDFSDNWTDADVTGPMDTMANWANSVGQGMPVYIGEWGSAWGSRYPAMQCNNIRLIYKTLGWQFAPAKGQPTALWDDGGWFKVFDHGTNSFANNLVDCIGGSCTWDGSARINTGCF